MEILLVLNGDYADEFDVESFAIVSEEYWETVKAKVKEFWQLVKDAKDKAFAELSAEDQLLYSKEPYRFRSSDFAIEKSFGTNEEMQWRSEEDFFRDFRASPIQEEDARVVRNLFGQEGCFGTVDITDLDEHMDYEIESLKEKLQKGFRLKKAY